MKFAASNIAWTFDERVSAYAMLQGAGFSGLEIAPGILFAGEDDVFAPSDRVVAQALAEVADVGLTLISMQALLFGVESATLFGAPDERQRFHTAMARAIALAGRLGVPNMVFGSPRQRIFPAGMSVLQAMAQAARTFQHLGDLALAAGTKLLIEPNPAAYGTNFLNTQIEVEAFLDLVDHRAVGGIIDTGAMMMNDEAFADIAVDLPRIHHVHCSAPQLGPAPVSLQAAQTVLAGLVALGYTGTVSIEAKRGAGGLADLQNSVAYLAGAAKSLGLMGRA